MRKIFGVTLIILSILLLVIILLSWNKIGIATYEVNGVSLNYPKHWNPVLENERVQFELKEGVLVAVLKTNGKLEFFDEKINIIDRFPYKDAEENDFKLSLL